VFWWDREARVPYAVEIEFDEAGAAAVRRLWAAIEDAGVGSLATATHRRHIPHLTLKVCDDIDVPAAVAALGQSTATTPAPVVTLGFVAVFAGPPDHDAAVVVAGAVVTDELLGLHAMVRKALSTVSSPTWEHYLPGRWVPHCTLAMPVPYEHVGVASGAAVAAGIPIVVRSAGLAIADVTTGDITAAARFAS
jgi:2'-5' RNA ligase